MKFTDEQVNAATKMRICKTLQHVQRAQVELNHACSMLSALEHGSSVHAVARKMYDKVHSLWYRVEALSNNPKVRLDRLNVQALEQGAQL